MPGSRTAAAAALAYAVACAQLPAPAPEPPPAPGASPSAPAPPGDASAREGASPEPPAAGRPAPDPLHATPAEVLLAEAAHLEPDARDAIARTVVALERRTGIPTLLTLALIRQESRFQPRAVGPRGALGLMQIRPFVAAKVAPRNGLAYRSAETLLDPAANVAIGCAYLAELHARFGTPRLALAAYNKGPTRVARELRRGSDPGDRFLSRVLRYYRHYEARFGAGVSRSTLISSEAAQ